MASAGRRRIVVAGASGLIGTALVERLRRDGDEVHTLVRRTPRGPDESSWAPSARTLDTKVLDGADAVINLAGATVARIPWTPAYRRKLVTSRIEATRTLAEAMGQVASPPPVLLNASAIGIYGDRSGYRITDASPRGEGFFPDLVEQWERVTAIAPRKTRVVTLRSAVVVARGGGLAPIRMLTAFGLGARFGTGGQHWPWISLEDEVRAIQHLLSSSLSGPVILAGPVPATSERITRAFARRMRRWRILRVPEWAIRLPLGEAGQRLLLDDLHVEPLRLAADGFEWRHRRVEQAVDAIFAR